MDIKVKIAHLQTLLKEIESIIRLVNDDTVTDKDFNSTSTQMAIDCYGNFEGAFATLEAIQIHSAFMQSKGLSFLNELETFYVMRTGMAKKLHYVRVAAESVKQDNPHYNYEDDKDLLDSYAHIIENFDTRISMISEQVQAYGQELPDPEAREKAHQEALILFKKIPYSIETGEFLEIDYLSNLIDSYEKLAETAIARAKHALGFTHLLTAHKDVFDSIISEGSVALKLSLVSDIAGNMKGAHTLLVKFVNPFMADYMQRFESEPTSAQSETKRRYSPKPN